ncbi:DUF4054 domain-containing protein [Aquabacter sp. CN5-332]|uniref:DUF4054 domain-containing protein n=1 Tax=Aquabacter sp. CN5-332 TaxID=3156608 RepID=UPI0032B3C3FF
MAYTPPTVAELKARFPEFAARGDVLLGLVLDEAIAQVGETWIEADRKPATLYLAAHLLASQGSGAGGDVAISGPVKRDRVGDSETEFAGVGGAAGQGDYGSTAYGQRFATYLRRNFPAVAVV